MTDPLRLPRISVVIPVHNGAEHLGKCLRALAASTECHEAIVVDDGSSDNSTAIAEAAGAIVLTTGATRGPAFARNLGAEAGTAELLLFIDSDVCVQPDSLARMRAAFDSDSKLSALFGSYDCEPHRPDFLSQYRNLMHHFVHQRSRHEAQTFWSGFGAIRKSVFKAQGGFDTSFSRPAVEDIELGHRLHQAGCKIILDPTLQVKHLKAWSFLGMLLTDVRDRAIPWTELMLRDSHMCNDLNVSISQRISVALAFLLMGIAIISSIINARLFVAPLIALLFLMLTQYQVELTTTRRIKGSVATALLIVMLAAASFWSGKPIIFAVSVLTFLSLLLHKHYYSPQTRLRRLSAFFAAFLLVGSIVFIAVQPGTHALHLLFLATGGLLIMINARFYALLASKRGTVYAIAAIPFHLLFFLYSGLAFLIAIVRHSFFAPAGNVVSLHPPPVTAILARQVENDSAPQTPQRR